MKAKSRLAQPPRRTGAVQAWSGAAVVIAVVTAAVVWCVSRPNQNTTAVSVFVPTRANATPPPSPAPEGMVWIPGGEFSIGVVELPLVK